MFKITKITAFFLVLQLLFSTGIAANGEICTIVGANQDKYVAELNGCNYSIVSRECCKDKIWSEWGENCPSCSASASSWSSTTDSSDTCPGGDYVGEYTCDGSWEGTCTDIKAEANDISKGSTSTLAFDPPTGYEFSYTDCSATQRKKNASIGIAKNGELQVYTAELLNTYCHYNGNVPSWDSNGTQEYDLQMYGKTSGKYYTNGSYHGISECPPNSDGDGAACQRICNLPTYPPAAHRRGCQQETTCYVLGEFTLSGCKEQGSYSAGGGAALTCKVGDGGYKYKFDLKKCGFKYSKRTVTCCKNN